jgi:hypothetical protein
VHVMFYTILENFGRYGILLLRVAITPYPID